MQYQLSKSKSRLKKQAQKASEVVLLHTAITFAVLPTVIALLFATFVPGREQSTPGT
jgi:hypothetical protein